MRNRTKALPQLTLRELRVLMFAAHGLTINEISVLLGLSTSAVRKHRAILIAKLQVSNITEAVTKTVSSGLVKYKPEQYARFKK